MFVFQCVFLASHSLPGALSPIEHSLLFKNPTGASHRERCVLLSAYKDDIYSHNNLYNSEEFALRDFGFLPKVNSGVHKA